MRVLSLRKVSDEYEGKGIEDGGPSYIEFAWDSERGTQQFECQSVFPRRIVLAKIFLSHPVISQCCDTDRHKEVHDTLQSSGD